MVTSTLYLSLLPNTALESGVQYLILYQVYISQSGT